MTVASLAVAGATAVGQTVPVPASGVWTVQGHGNGHGHGLSQYGARGAAIAGLSSEQIVGFFYPHTTLVSLGASTIRVQLTATGSTTTVSIAPGQTVRLSWAGGALQTDSAHTSAVRLTSGSAGYLQPQYYGAGWVNWGHVQIPGRADFASSSGVLRIRDAGGGSVDYQGTVGAVTGSGGLITVNRLSLEDYVRAVVPREMPASWQSAAVQAQAIAARTYARYEVEHHGSSSTDICDTTNCQVYGGLEHYDSNGNAQYGVDSRSDAAVAATAGRVLTYAGSTIFAQFAASDGGYTLDGGQPYLISQPDPYDDAASGDPWLNWTYSVRVSDVAAYFGLARVTQLEITQVDGHGQWGGRVLAGRVDGVDGRGTPRSVAASGYDLQDAMSLPHNWFHIAGFAPGAPVGVKATPADSAALVSWSAPGAGPDPVTAYLVSVPGYPTLTVGAGARSAWVGGLVNGRSYQVSVQAVNADGAGPAAAVGVAARATPMAVNAVGPARLFDTGASGQLVDPAHPFVFAVAGHGGIPTGALGAVQLVVTVVSSSGGSLRVHTDGSPQGVQDAIAYRPGIPVTATVSVPLVTSGRVVFAPSAGSVRVIADQLGYSAATGSVLTPTGPSVVALVSSLATGPGRSFTLRGTAVPGSATAVLLSVVGSSAAGGYVRLWPDGSAIPGVGQVALSPDVGGANLVMVPLGPDGAIRLAARYPATGVAVTVVGYLSGSATGAGRLETTPVTTIARGRLPATGIAVPVPAAVVPAGARAVLATVTLIPNGRGGTLSLWPTGRARPSVATMRYAGSSAVTTTVLMPVSGGGALNAVADGGSVIIAIDVLGWVTAG